MRKHASTMILILILVVGLSLMLYPSFSNWWNEAHQSRAIAAYSQEVSKLDENRYDELWQQAREYNRSLVGRENAYLLDDSQKAEYERLLRQVIDDPALPVVCGLNVGHALPRCIVPLGVPARVDVQAQKIEFL